MNITIAAAKESTSAPSSMRVRNREPSTPSLRSAYSLSRLRIRPQLFEVECLLGKDHAKKQHDAQRQRNQQGAPLREGKRTIAFIRLLFGHNTARASISKIRGSPATHYSWMPSPCGVDAAQYEKVALMRA